MTTAKLTERLDGMAKAAFENAEVAVECRGGVLWLTRCGRTFATLGLPKAGLRRLLVDLKRQAEAR